MLLGDRAMRNRTGLMKRHMLVLGVIWAVALGFTAFAATRHSGALIYWVLGVVGAFSLLGIAFSIWVGIKSNFNPE